MQSNKFLETARKIAIRDRTFFNTLVEFEKTKQLRTKTKLNFTIDKTVAREFRRFCREKGYNMSAKIEQAMKDLMSKRS